MEEMLIEYVRSNTVLYDPTNREYRNQHSRKEAWDEIGEKLRITDNECKDNWNKLRNAYIQAKHRRDTKSGEAAKSVSKWKFEDEMAFFNPTLVTRKTRRNAENSPNNEDYDGRREETGLCPIDETDLQVASSESSQSSPPRNDLLKTAVPTMAEAIDNPTSMYQILQQFLFNLQRSP
ncbi:uncharacterized protein LOC126285502 [Schistocerca gregaria]|uniref:uncharacterized protein LOC126285502 n=1 Tax=Schistocerca gregaria TaxID=7010 RepID=UPI00211F2C51|nr:uncharacterized protein LOC126285502 [Schistocerca gregaria]